MTLHADPASETLHPLLLSRLAEARAKAARPLDAAETGALVAEVMTSLSPGRATPDAALLHRELSQLAHYIDQTRSEVAALKPDEIRTTHIPSATDELDAIVGATEKATGTILDACEGIETLAATLPAEAADALTGAVTSIYEACNFQDITGQRITKVVKALKQIETKVDALLAAFGEGSETAAQPAPAAGEAALLNGPALPGQGVDQAEIDRLLAEFD